MLILFLLTEALENLDTNYRKTYLGKQDSKFMLYCLFLIVCLTFKREKDQRRRSFGNQNAI